MVDDVYPCFEISAINADKPPLKIDEIKDRVKQFEGAGRMFSLNDIDPFLDVGLLFALSQSNNNYKLE